MKLSDIKTADALILQLSAQGYTKFFEDDDRPELLGKQKVGIFSYGEYQCDHCGTKLRQVNVWPCQINDRGDAGFSAVLNASQEIIEWFAFESYAGTATPLNPDSDLERVTAAINSWLAHLQEG